MGKARRKDRENASEESKLYLQEPCLERKVQEDDLLCITEVPSGLDANEWHALHTIGFFEHINLLYGTVSEFCNLTSCPEMIGPGPRVYMWLDDRGKKSKLSAPQYVDYVMTYVQKTVNDETVFPTKHGNDFPANFETVLKRVQKLLFHVVAHIYHSHFREIVLLGLHAHLNSIFAHIIEYNFFYHILEDKEVEVLQDLVKALKLAPDKSSLNTSSCSDDLTAKETSSAEEAKDPVAENTENSEKEISSTEEISRVEPSEEETKESEPAEKQPKESDKKEEDLKDQKKEDVEAVSKCDEDEGVVVEESGSEKGDREERNDEDDVVVVVKESTPEPST